MINNPRGQIRHRLTILLLVLNLLIICVMQYVGQSLKPYNIIQFELARTVERAITIVNTWSEMSVMNDVSFLIGFDYLFMATYSSLLWLTCTYVASSLSGRFAVAVRFLAGLQFVAAGLDATENIALFKMANLAEDSFWPALSYYCAMPKFLIVILGLLVSIIGWVYVMRSRSQQP